MKSYVETEPHSPELPVFFMGRWIEKELNNVQTMYTTNLGAQILFKTSQTKQIELDFIRTIPDGATNQTLSIDIDHSKAIVELSNTKLNLNLPNSSDHIIKITFAGNTDADQVWTEQAGLAIKSITCAEGTITAIKPIGKTIAFIGDSITAGCWVRSKSPSSGYGADINYAARTAEYFDAIDYRIAYSAAGILRYGAGGVPAAGRFLNYIDINTSAPSIEADLVIVNLGTNDCKFDDATFTAFFKQFLNEVQNKFQGSKISVLIPFNQAFANAITSLISNDFSNEIHLIKTSHWHVQTTDGTHPNKVGSIHASHNLIAAIKKMNLI
ncbi:GDSL-type esterase/lipase family protein [Pediococcus argentinicus]|uniref:GDSL-type esterase/lipase family protein n=1 Tax=Pediococcus argentinicus TaxID=480391 RepID=UPI00338DE557